MMQEFRGQTVLTFDKGGPGAIVVEHLQELEGSIRHWLQENIEYIEFVVPIENSLTTDPVQAMFCGPVELMQQALQALDRSGLPSPCFVPSTLGATCRSWMCSTQTVPRGTRSSAG